MLTALVGRTCDQGYCIPTPILFVRERENRYDSNAFRAEIQGRRIGYLRREIAAELTPALDRAVRVLRRMRHRPGGSTGAPNLGFHVWLGKRVTLGPIIEMDDVPWQMPWPPNGWETARFR